MQYFFVLGKNPTLSIAEIFSLFGRDKIKFKIIGLSVDVLLIKTETEKELEINYLMKQLGGLIKLGVSEAKEYAKISELNANELINFFLGKVEGKTLFGISLYKLDSKINLFEINQEIRKLGLEIKKKLKEKGRPSRFVVERRTLALSSVGVGKNKLLERGAEIVVLVDKDKIYLGQTLAVQEFEEYSFRDYGRPRRDILSGMMPPKLAKIMVNLAQVDFKQTILDPFCGSGTILSEAMLMGYKNLIGSDISKKAIEDTKRNLEWLKRNYELESMKYELLESDVRKLIQKLPLASVDAIITEPFLGPPLRASTGLEEIKRIAREVGQLYLEAFRVFKNLLKPNGRIVIIFPVFKPKEKQKFFYLPILKEIKHLGFKIKIPFSFELQNYPLIKITDRGSIIHSRPEQRILREIFIWEK